MMGRMFLSFPHRGRWLPKADGRSSAVTFCGAKVPHCRDENTAEEINCIFALTVFLAILFSAQNAPIVLTIRMMYQANSFRHASPHIRRMSKAPFEAMK